MKNKIKAKHLHISIIILGIIFISISAFHPSIWFDESYSVAIAKHNFADIWQITGNDVHPPLYYLMLRIAMNFTKGYFSKWPGIVLNIIIYTFVTIIMYLILKKLLKKDNYSIEKAGILAFMSSIVLASLSNVIYIRMYSLLTLIILITIYLQTSGIIRNINSELTKHIQLLVACNPNEYFLIKLYIKANINTSNPIFNKNAIEKIITDLVISI